MAKSSSVSYDYYLMTNGKWLLKGRYPGHMRDYVLKEAKAEEAKNNIPVKVVRDFYNEDAEAWEEVIVYVSGNAYGGGGDSATANASSRPSGGTGIFGSDGPVTPAMQKEVKKKASTLLNQLTRFFIIIFGSFVFAVVVTIVCMHFLQSTSYINSRILSLYSTYIAVGVFVLSFMLSSVPLLFFFIDARVFQFNFSFRKKQAPPPKRVATQADTLISQLASANPLKKKVVLTESKEQEILEASVDSIVANHQDEPSEVGEEKTPSEQVQEQPRSYDTLVSNSPRNVEGDTTENPAPVEKETDVVEENRLVMMRFLKAIIAAFRAERQQLELNGYNKLGIQLLFSGALETLAQAKQLSAEQRNSIFQAVQKTLTIPAPIIAMFQTNYENHQNTPRSAKMIETGRTEMKKFVDNFDYVPAPIVRAFDSWTKDNNARTALLSGEDTLIPTGTENQDPTVLLAEVTLPPLAEGQAPLSDEIKEKITDERNSLVLHIMQQHFGQDIRDGGHSVTALFPDIDSAVQAGIALHSMVSSYKEETSNQTLQVRTGIFSPSEEIPRATAENEAWSLCGAAHYGQILCNEKVSRSIPPEKIASHTGGHYIISW